MPTLNTAGKFLPVPYLNERLLTMLVWDVVLLSFIGGEEFYVRKRELMEDLVQLYRMEQRLPR